VKNDKVDARKIALLYRFQELKTTNIPTRILNVCEAFAASTTSSLTNLLLTKQAYGIVDQLMLNFKDVFPNIFSKAALAVLEKYLHLRIFLKRTETS